MIIDNIDSTENSSGTLYIVATPIGNLEDISQRAINTLKNVDAILAEDTRHSLPLLHALGIGKPLVSLHAHNENEKSQSIIEQLLHGSSFALISDAGTPLISDPGFVLVREARLNGIKVTPVPGACALIAALSVAGTPCDNFIFEGFLPAKQQARINKLQAILSRETTCVIYESTHRIIACLHDIATVFGQEYELVLAKEITKLYECFIQANCNEIINWLEAESGRVKGEFVLILPAVYAQQDNSETDRILKILLEELPLKQAVKIAAQLTNISKNDLYKQALRLGER
ncbi:16S rRNA (cytidine(1402)-2'-O)-methyltransferase [Legionella dresdenensis]|uniref:Ribosomal RNA small subunit methyltransferase I n=1 Tax=Legionella dresdenensis TaxID=450200 RepID=A0ABV8CE07_9GAMM